MYPFSQQQQNLPGISTNPDEWDWGTPTPANQAQTPEVGSFRAGSLFGTGAVAGPSFGIGASFGPGAVAGPSFGIGALFGPGAVAGPSFGPVTFGAEAGASFGPGTGFSLGAQASFGTETFQPTGNLGKRSFIPTIESEIERPAPKVQTLGPEDADKLDEWGYFVDEPIPEEMEVGGIAPNTNQEVNTAREAQRNVPLVARRRLNTQQRQQSGAQFYLTQQNHPPQPPY